MPLYSHPTKFAENIVGLVFPLSSVSIGSSSGDLVSTIGSSYGYLVSSIGSSYGFLVSSIGSSYG